MENEADIGYRPRAPRFKLPEYGPREVPESVLVAPAQYVTVALASAITGFTQKAIRRKIEDGKWVEGEQWRRTPDGTILISVDGYRKWVEQAPGRRLYDNRTVRASSRPQTMSTAEDE